MSLNGTIDNEGNGYGALAFFLPVNGLQNGAPDGLALVDPSSAVIQFLSYEGAFTATNGPANGTTSTDIGVSEVGNEPLGLSLQLEGAGNMYSQFVWAGPIGESAGSLNANQGAGPIIIVATFTESITPGNCTGNYTIIRTYTAEDDCGNQAMFVQNITVEDTTPPVPGCQNITVYLDQNGEGMFDPADLNNGSTDNCGLLSFSADPTVMTCADKGVTPVTLIVSDDCGNTASCVSQVTVIDDIPPTLTCPSDIIVNLDPGACCAIVSWTDPTATDNCPFSGPSGMVISAPAASNNQNAVGGIVVFDLVNNTAGPLTISSMSSMILGPTMVGIYVKSGTGYGFEQNAGAWTLAYTADATAGPFNPTLTPFTTDFVIPPGVTGVALHMISTQSRYTNGTPAGVKAYGLSTNGTYTDGTLTVLAGATSNTFFASAPFNPRIWNGSVTYQTPSVSADPIQTGGPLSGTELCKDDSPWTVSYEVSDVAGNVSTCSFDIQVLEYPDPVTSLACNDLVQISLDEDCITTIGADDILEGGPYGCYDDYIVSIFNPNNTPLVGSPNIGRPQIGLTLKVKVTDPETGNSCWGLIKVEDKLPPVLVCTDLEVNCGADIPLEPAPAVFQQEDPVQYPASFLAHGGGTAYSLSGNTLPGGIYFNITNNSAEELEITGFGLRFGDPAFGPVNAPQTMEVFTAPTFVGNETNAGAWTNLGPQNIATIPAYFATGTGDLAQLELSANQVLAPGETRGFHVWGATACPIFNYFNGTAPVTNGPFTVAGGPVSFGLLSNLFQAGAVSMPNIQVNYASKALAVPVTDNCDITLSLGNGLTYADDETFYTCAQDPEFSQLIERTWTAVDDWGNNTQCTQEIRIKRATIQNVVLPSNYDDLDLPSLDCQADYPSPAVTGEPGGSGCGSLQTGFEDKVLQVCQSSYTIIRTWTLHDMCSGEVGTHVQTIKILDKTGPVLSCPDEHDITYGTTNQQGYQDCTVRVYMPWIQVEDDCSTSNNTNLYVWTTDNNGNVIIVNTMNADGKFVFDLPVGYDYTMTYVAIDDCGNKSECSIVVEVEDKQGPVVICESFHVVALTDSVTLVNASSFDDGSYDVCTSIVFDIRRGTMNSSGSFVQHPCNKSGDFIYQPQVKFYCCDGLSSVPVFVDLRVRDAFGNANNCMVEVQVVDKIRPVIWCPEDITVTCGMPYEPTGLDTFSVCKTPGTIISNAYQSKYTVPIDITGIPADARITDLDLQLNINHEWVDQLEITLYSPTGTKVTVMPWKSCAKGSTPNWYPADINVTFNDEAYDLIQLQKFNQIVPAQFTCTSTKPSVGSYNQGHMRPKGDYLKAFDGDALNSWTDKDLCFTAGMMDVNTATNRLSNTSIAQFITKSGLSAGDQLVMKYVSSTGAELGDLTIGWPYLFKVINGSTVEFLDVLGSDITVAPAGSNHMFCATDTWILVVEDKEVLAGGKINEVCMHIEYVLPTGLKPHVTDNTEACGLDVTWQDLGDPEKCGDNTFINRRWRVEDKFGNNTSCIQRVYFNDDTPLVVQFPCDVTVNCENLDDLDATGGVIHNGDCELVGIEHVDHVLVTTDACYKILRQWIVKDWCKYSADGNVDYQIQSFNQQYPAMTTWNFTTAINSLVTAKKLQAYDVITMKYITTVGGNEIGGLIEGDVYAFYYLSGTSFQVFYNTTKQQPVNQVTPTNGNHIFRYANSSLGLPQACDVIAEWYPFTEWHGLCPSPQGCRAWEDDGDGYYTFTQEIKVVDNEAPEWVDCSDMTFCSFEADCEPTEIELMCPATDNCTDSSELVYQYFLDAFNDGTVDVVGVGFDASGAYPNGTHKITFKVSDQCGNFNTCTKLFTISDCKKPTPICHAVSIELMPSTGMAEVWATSLEVGDSYDNCTEYGDLQILVERLSDVGAGQDAPDADAGPSIVVTCNDLPPVTQSPVVEVVVWVGDEAGNWDYCVTTITVQDWMGACGGTMNAELTGYVADESGEPVELVEIDLTGNGNNMSMQTTGNSGAVSFGTIPTVGQYTVTPQKDINPLNGVSTYDLLLIQKHLLAIKTIGSPYRLIAADVNNNCTISISDIIELRKMILAPGTLFANNTSWRFVEAGYAFPNPNKPCNFMEMKGFNGLQLGMNTASFIGVKTGDVSGDAQPNSLLGVESRNTVGSLEFAVDERSFVAGEIVTFEVKAGNFQDIQGYQYTIGLDPEVLQFVGVEATWTDLSSTNFGQSRTAQGVITTSWNGSEPITLGRDEVLYRITVKTRTSGRLSEAITLNSKVTRAEAYDRTEELLDVHFRFDNGVIAGGDFALYQNEPNPFGDLTRIGFHLPGSGSAVLTVHDITGKVVHRAEGDFNQGYNEFILRAAEVSAQGMLYYTVQSGEHMATKRMIMQE